MGGVTNGALSEFAKLSETALALPPGMPRDAWEDMGEQLRRIEAAVGWWLGDWWLFGEREYGEAASQAAPTGLAAKTLQNYARVSERIEPSRRRESLSIGHHEAVAGLEDPAEQDRWLDKAEADEMPVAQLRARIRHATRDVDMPSETVKLLRRAVEAARLDPDVADRQTFLDLADEAWQHVHGLTSAQRP